MNDLGEAQNTVLLEIWIISHLNQAVTSICDVQNQTQKQNQTILKTTSYSRVLFSFDKKKDDKNYLFFIDCI